MVAGGRFGLLGWLAGSTALARLPARAQRAPRPVRTKAQDSWSSSSSPKI